MSKKVAGYASLGLALIVFAPSNVFATAIPITGTGDLVKSNGTADVSVSSNTLCIAFSGSAPACAGTATPFNVSSGSDSIFKTGLTGTIKDISTTPITAFETVQLSTTGSATFDLESIITPTGYASCSGPFMGACSTGFFVLSQISPNQVQIGLALNELGYVTGSSTSTGSTNYVGNFSTTLSGSIAGCTGDACTDTIANILAWEAGAGHSVSSTWSATESPVSGVPEPMTFSLMGLGLLGVGLISRRRKQS